MKNLKTILLLFFANSISGVAQGISLIAIPWYFAQANDMQSFGIIYIIVTIISLFWVPYGGTLIDKYNRKHIFLWLTAVCGIIILSVAGYGYYLGTLPTYLVATVFIVTFLNFNIHYPNLYAFLQEITDKEHYGNITSYVEIQGQTTSMLAGAFAAMLLEGTQNGHLIVFGFNINLGFDIHRWSIHEIFLMDGITYFISFITIMSIRYQPLER
ncbi:MAG TPA: MFS transporter, partial [Saprospiraceae bacterium]|nr:MFS transporter [Saprospiraceae bacterium]